RGRVILSPTPPVECLSEVGRDSDEKYIRSPEASIACVQSAISDVSMSLMKIAMARAAICSSATTPRVEGSITQTIGSLLRARPWRLAAMTPMGSHHAIFTLAHLP